jgi:hypothetical protein
MLLENTSKKQMTTCSLQVLCSVRWSKGKGEPMEEDGDNKDLIFIRKLISRRACFWRLSD